MTIDLNRGATIRIMPDGRRACMYKDAPGIYFDGAGKPMADVDAKAAGFDIKRLGMEKRKNEALSSARSEIERKHAAQITEVERVMEHHLEGNRLHVAKGGDKNWQILDQDDNVISGIVHSRRADATAILEMAGIEEQAAEEEETPPDDPKPKSEGKPDGSEA